MQYFHNNNCEVRTLNTRNEIILLLFFRAHSIVQLGNVIGLRLVKELFQ